VTVLPGFNDDVFSGLEVHVRELQDRDRVCSLTVDEMSLKSNLAYDRAHDVVVGYEDFGSLLPHSAVNATSELTFMVRISCKLESHSNRNIYVFRMNSLQT